MAYVYGHYKADTGELFYIGKGTGKRAWARDSRNAHWQNIVNKHGFVVKVLEDGMTDGQAYIREKELIAEVGLSNLTNVREGGDNPTSADVKRMYENEEYKKKIAEINAKRSREQANCPIWLAKVTEGNRNRGPEFRKNVSVSIQKKYDEDPEYKQRVIEANRKLAQTPEWREKNLKVIEVNRNSSEFKRKASDASNRRWANPEYRQKMLEIRRSPEYRKKMSDIHKGRLPSNRRKSSSNLNDSPIDCEQ
jgi:hypothetical protein